jgi:hypothetical protein
MPKRVAVTLVTDGRDYWSGDVPYVCADELHRRFDLPPCYPGAAIEVAFAEKPGPDALRLKLDGHAAWDLYVAVGVNEERHDSFRALRAILDRFPGKLAYMTVYPLEVQP